MHKLQKIAGSLDTFFKVTYRLTIAANILGCIFIAIFLYLCLGAPSLFSKITAGLITSLDFGSIQFRLSPDALPATNAGTGYFFGSLILGLLGLAVYILMIRSIRSILAPMKEGLPFHREVAAGFRNLALLTILSGLLDLVLEFFIRGNMIRSLDLNTLFLSDKIEAVTTYYNFSFNFLITALVFFGMSCIFRYGEELQQLSDETL